MHIDIIERGVNLGDQLIVAVSLNSGKQPLFIGGTDCAGHVRS